MNASRAKAPKATGRPKAKRTAARPAKKSSPTVGALVLRPLRLPTQHHATLSNGLRVTVVPRGPLPMVSVRLVTRSGSATDPVGKLGLAELTARLLRRGAGGLSANELGDAIDLVGAGISAWSSEDSFGVSLSTPTRHFEQLLELMGKITLEPDFPDAELEQARRRTLAQLTNGLDDPESLADRALLRAVWGDHPYGHETIGQKADLERIGRDDLVAAHRWLLAPSQATLFVVGSVDPEQTFEQVDRVFGRWVMSPTPPRVLPPWNGPVRAGEVLIVDKPEQTQAQVRLTSLGVRRGHPDHFPLTVMNTVLGGGFTSRLVTQIRVKRGLTYGAGSHFEQLAEAGTFNVSSFTKTETVPELLDVALAELDKMKARGPTAAEVTVVQRYIAGLYPARLETNDSVASALSDMRLFKLPDDWVDQYRERIAAVTVEAAAQAARQHLPAQWAMVLVGNARQLQPMVSRFGRVTVLKPEELE